MVRGFSPLNTARNRFASAVWMKTFGPMPDDAGLHRRFPAAGTEAAAASVDDELYIKSAKQKNVCTKILEFFTSSKIEIA